MFKYWKAECLNLKHVFCHPVCFYVNPCLWISAAFFQDCISEQDLDEMNIEIIRNTLYKVKQQNKCKMMNQCEIMTKFTAKLRYEYLIWDFPHHVTLNDFSL